MPWNSAKNNTITIGRVARCVACNAWVDSFATPAWREMTKKLRRFLRSRVLINDLMRALRRRGGSKHSMKNSGCITHEATCFLKSHGLDSVMDVFFLARY